MLYVTSTSIVSNRQINTSRMAIQEVLRQVKEGFGRSQAAFSGKSYSLVRSIERRDDIREPVETPIYIHPVNVTDSGVVFEQENPVAGLTQNVSTQGIGFSYDAPLRGRYILVEVDLFKFGPQQLLVERRWHRKKDAHAYVGGGVVVGVLDSTANREVRNSAG